MKIVLPSVKTKYKSNKHDCRIGESLDDLDLESSLRAVISCPGGGTCVMSGFPGLQTSIDGEAYTDPHNLKATMADISNANVNLLVILAEADELPDDAFPALKEEAARIDLPLAFLSIPDFQAPDDAMLAAWEKLTKECDDLPNSGGSVGFSCQYGAGRSGTMVAYVLMKLGMDKDIAIKTIRDQFPEAIESEKQLIFLEKISARLKDQCADLDP